jgi:hypothetical protein
MNIKYEVKANQQESYLYYQCMGSAEIGSYKLSFTSVSVLKVATRPNPGKRNEDIPAHWRLCGVGRCSDSLPNHIRVNQTRQNFGRIVWANTAGWMRSSSLSKTAFECLYCSTNKQAYPSFCLRGSPGLSGQTVKCVSEFRVARVLACVVVVSC